MKKKIIFGIAFVVVVFLASCKSTNNCAAYSKADKHSNFKNNAYTQSKKF